MLLFSCWLSGISRHLGESVAFPFGFTRPNKVVSFAEKGAAEGEVGCEPPVYPQLPAASCCHRLSLQLSHWDYCLLSSGHSTRTCSSLPITTSTLAGPSPRIWEFSGLEGTWAEPELQVLEVPGAHRGSACGDKSFPLISLINYFHTLHRLESHANSSKHSIVISAL